MENKISISNQNAVLKELKESLNSYLGESLVRFVLFGSRVRGDYDSNSDIDVAIVVRGMTRNIKNQILGTIAEIELAHLVPISALVLSEDEFENLKRLERRIALDIEREGQPI